ncbi:MAG: sodium ion-translocating decarboxylase subunit beta [Bacteroidales bacterium]|nr:sodium ion-translocating decarboxylase subunit beta [Bacteroidales bacterium]MBQ2499266.1 sodium ion-translocating decarboxylase subunit beta [Bacteroidales bacterium]MBQ4205945.1 sodium ion-translocating decarboxylase subunit beta [Bacteroidales bacterium]MCR5037639.1 sodium ion-translocating decarboxylase subunit beta [Bacteroidales bacterium]
MILVAFVFIFLAVKYDFEPMLLIPIGVGIIVGNIPFIQDSYTFDLQGALAALSKIEIQGNSTFDLTEAQKFFVGLFAGQDTLNCQQALDHFHEMIKTNPDQLAAFLPAGMDPTAPNTAKFFDSLISQVFNMNIQTGVYQKGSVLNYLYFGVRQGIYPPLIFLGIGAMTDFSSLISQPRLMILGAAAQLGVFITFISARALGFDPHEAAAIGIIGGADGPTAIFISTKMAPHLLGAIAIAAYSYMALVPVIQPPIMRLLTTKEERLIKMKEPRMVGKTEKVIFPIVGLLLTTFISPSALPLLGMLFFGNLLKESGVTKRLANTAANPLIDIVTILLGLTVGASTQADVFLTVDSLIIFALGACSFAVATFGGVCGAKLMNLFCKEGNKINPLIGNAGVSAVPDAARVSEVEGQKYDPSNHLLMHAMAPNVAGVIGSAVAAGILMSFIGI